jgi:hypothetical protein
VTEQGRGGLLREGQASRGEKGDASRFDWMKGASIKRNADGTIELLEKAVEKPPEEVYASEASVCVSYRLLCDGASLGRVCGSPFRRSGASSGRRLGQRARKRPAGVPGSAWCFTGCGSRGSPICFQRSDFIQEAPGPIVVSHCPAWHSASTGGVLVRWML